MHLGERAKLEDRSRGAPMLATLLPIPVLVLAHRRRWLSRLMLPSFTRGYARGRGRAQLLATMILTASFFDR